MDIKQSSSGKFIKSSSAYNSYFTNKLPPKIVWTKDLINSLSKADYMLGKLSK